MYRGGKRDGRRDQWDPRGNYSAETYLFALKASGIALMRNRDLLRYLELAVGYRAHGFELVNGSPPEGARHLYYDVSRNLAQCCATPFFAIGRVAACSASSMESSNSFRSLERPPSPTVASEPCFNSTRPPSGVFMRADDAALAGRARRRPYVGPKSGAIDGGQ